MARSSNNVELHRKHYRAKFVESLDGCALHRRGAQDRFLFHARLALEAAVRAVFTQTGKLPPAAKGTSDLLKELLSSQLVQATQVADFDVIRTRTNPAAHVPVPGESIQSDSVTKVANNLGSVWDWVGSQVEFPDDECRTIDAALRVIQGVEHRESPDQELTRLREDAAKLRRSEAALKEQVRLRGRDSHVSSRESRWPVLLIVVALGTGLMLGGWLGVHFAPRSSEDVATRIRPSEVREPAAFRDDVSSDAGPLDRGPTSRESPMGAPTPAEDNPSDPSTTCPASMVFVSGATLSFAPPIDRTWCGDCAPRTLEVPSFCIMNRVVTFEELRARFQEAERGCRYDIASDAAHCVSTERAREYCELEFGAGARPPSVAELELAQRSSPSLALPTAPREPSEFEWSVDGCPSPAFGSSPRRGRAQAVAGGVASPPQLPIAQLSWHCPTDLPTRNHRFRCVLPSPTEAEGVE